jgi:hypothetical protein
VEAVIDGPLRLKTDRSALLMIALRCTHCGLLRFLDASGLGLVERGPSSGAWPPLDWAPDDPEPDSPGS